MFQPDVKHLAAALLHPLYRRLSFIDDYKKSKTLIYVRQLLKEIFTNAANDHQNSNSTKQPSEPAKKKHKTIEDQFTDPDDLLDQNMASNSSVTDQNGDELEKYLKMPIEDQFKLSNPLPFWNHYQEKFPFLSKLARKLFSIPATSAGVERQFSSAGFLINERRASLNPDTVENILFVRSVQKQLIKNPNCFSLQSRV